MPKYEVTVKEIEIYVIPDIEANSEDEAITKAYEILDAGEKWKFHSDSDGEAVVSDSD